MGDAVDRGDNGVELLQFIRKNAESLTLLLGNHEYMMVRSLSTSDPKNIQNWLLNGGRQTMRAFLQLPQKEQCDLLAWLREVPISVRTKVGNKTFLLVHGWPGDSIYDVVWGRPESFLADPGVEKATVVIGHTPTPLIAKGTISMERYLRLLAEQNNHIRILHTPGYIDVDCGCGHDVYGARLACLRLDDMAEFYV
jgi:serine/threonine protein phosphatase 1